MPIRTKRVTLLHRNGDVTIRSKVCEFYAYTDSHHVWIGTVDGEFRRFTDIDRILSVNEE